MELKGFKIVAVAIAIAISATNRAHADGSAAASTPSATSTQSAQKTSDAAGKKTEAKSAQAKSAGNEGEQKLAPVVVTATRIEEPASDVGVSVTVVEKQQIDDQKIQQVEGALREVPSVVVTQQGSNGSLTDVSIRGAESNQTLVMIDGVEVNKGSTGGFDFATQMTPGFDRIEVVRGGGGALYGSSAIGGVINLISEQGEGPAHFTMLSEGGNRAAQGQVATFGGSSGKLDYSGSLNYFSTEGFRLANDNSDNLTGATRLDYHLDADTTIRVFARYIRSNVSLPEYQVFFFPPISLDPTAHQREEFMLFKGELEHRFSDHLDGRMSAFYVRDEVRINDYPFNAVPNPGTNFEADDYPDEIRGSNSELIYSWNSNWRTLVGFDFKDRWARSTSNATAFPPPTSFTERRQEYAGYVQQQGSLFDGRLIGTGGCRVDGNSQFGEEFSPSWSVTMPVKEIATTFRGSYSEGFRAPSFNELYYPDFGNPNLQPELSSEYDGGFTTTLSEWGQLSANYFSRRVHNLIVAVFIPPATFTEGNTARVDVQGVEIIPSVGPFYGFTLNGFFTILDETHVSGPQSTAQPLRVPKRSAYGLLQYARTGIFHVRDRVVASLGYNFVGDRDDITTQFTVGNNVAYHLFNAAVSYEGRMPWYAISDEEVFARVSNLFDRNYSQTLGYPSPRVNFVAGVQVSFF
ncbi:MAG TPA: TonB-dependent receptor [Candidatus Binataceae bacterium]|nr:TonB-dependent receptor [Candidatus Binataceae bacterium]